MDETKELLPIFRDYSLEELHAATGYVRTYLVDVLEGTAALTDRFKRIACKDLGKTEAELFGPQEPAS